MGYGGLNYRAFRSIFRPTLIKNICIFQHGKFLSELPHLLQVDFRRSAGGTAAEREKAVAIRVYQGGAALVMAMQIIANAVNARHVALVFNGSRTQQNVPCRLAAGRPRRHIDDEVVRVFRRVARGHGKAEVVTDLRQNANVAHLHHHALATGKIMGIFSAVAKEMALGVVANAAVWPHDKQGVDKPTAAQARFCLPSQRTSNAGIQFFGLPQHPFVAHLRLLQRVLVGRDIKSRTPHFGQDIKVGAGLGSHERLCPPDVLLGISPCDVYLQQ